jgi:hypothetical protein
VDGLAPTRPGGCELDRTLKLDENVAGSCCPWPGGERVSSSLTTLVILITLIHVAVLAVMIWIRVRNEADGTKGGSTRITPCAICGAPSTHRSYDGLDPNAQYDPTTGRYSSNDIAHYPPLCNAH